ncbi:MAG: DNA repair protein RadA [Candidatus Cloacimonadota bacterium]|nr:MAG: DNA repair protein RadA [Candidatus Cloacimonadota bacterium]
MKKDKVTFVCQGCGYSSLKWMGKCPNCGEWNSFVEERVVASKKRGMAPSEPVKLNEIKSDKQSRWVAGISEFDRVLGGGIVPGTIILIGGEPGVGKSTLLLDISSNLARGGKRILYVSGEESVYQIGLRAKRLGVETENLFLLFETSVENIIESIKKVHPSIVIVDSIQAIFDADIGSSPGSVSQVRECTSKLTKVAKEKEIALFLVGHVTKIGMIAGPRTLEHMVDTVLYLEGDRTQSFRILRAVKNRFGSINEIGVFEMAKNGLVEVKNPSMIFLDERGFNTSGAVVVSTIEGTRPILAEVQALVSPTRYPVPQRVIVGSDYKRFSILLAVLERRAGYNLGGFDVFCNVVGGLKILNPSADLGLVVAVASNFDDRPCNNGTVVIGEIGLGGEVRAVTQIERRVKEAERLGFTRCIIPIANQKGLSIVNIKTIGVKNLKEAIEKSIGNS